MRKCLQQGNGVIIAGLIMIKYMKTSGIRRTPLSFLFFRYLHFLAQGVGFDQVPDLVSAGFCDRGEGNDGYPFDYSKGFLQYLQVFGQLAFFDLIRLGGDDHRGEPVAQDPPVHLDIVLSGRMS